MSELSSSRSMMRRLGGSKPDRYLLGSYRMATAPEPNSSRSTSFKSTRFEEIIEEAVRLIPQAVRAALGEAAPKIASMVEGRCAGEGARGRGMVRSALEDFTALGVVRYARLAEALLREAR